MPRRVLISLVSPSVKPFICSRSGLVRIPSSHSSCLQDGGLGAVVLCSYSQKYCPLSVHTASVHPDRCLIWLSVPPSLNRWCKGAQLSVTLFACLCLGCGTQGKDVILMARRVWCFLKPMLPTWAASNGSGDCLPSCCLPTGYVSQLVEDFME